MTRFLKFLVLILIMAAIPFVWWTSIQDANLRSILFSTGGSLFLLGLCYKLMGSWDLIPDWLPLIGGLDDTVAWFVMLGGLLLGGAGYMLGG